jgi:hypothetical protein
VDFIDVVAVRDALNFIPIKAQVQILAGDIDPFSCAQDRGRGRPMRKRKEGGTGGGRERRERERDTGERTSEGGSPHQDSAPGSESNLDLCSGLLCWLMDGAWKNLPVKKIKMSR